MGLLQDLLQQHNTSLEGMSQDEMDSFFNLLRAAESKSLDMPKLKLVLRDLISAVERDLIDADEYDYAFFGLVRRLNRKHLFLKARLHNYLVLEGMVTSPERARRAMEDVIERLGKNNPGANATRTTT